MKPYLFLDVDGVVNALDPSLPVTFRAKCYPIRIQEWVPRCVQELDEAFEIVWCTTWRGEAEPTFRGPLGLTGHRAYVDWLRMKLPDLLRYAKDRPWAFADDEAEWELRQLHGSFRDTGLFIIPDGNVGLTVAHTHILLEYADAQGS